MQIALRIWRAANASLGVAGTRQLSRTLSRLAGGAEAILLEVEASDQRHWLRVIPDVQQQAGMSSVAMYTLRLLRGTLLSVVALSLHHVSSSNHRYALKALLA